MLKNLCKANLKYLPVFLLWNSIFIKWDGIDYMPEGKESYLFVLFLLGEKKSLFVIPNSEWREVNRTTLKCYTVSYHSLIYTIASEPI